MEYHNRLKQCKLILLSHYFITIDSWATHVNRSHTNGKCTICIKWPSNILLLINANLLYTRVRVVRLLIQQTSYKILLAHQNLSPILTDMTSHLHTTCGSLGFVHSCCSICLPYHRITWSLALLVLSQLGSSLPLLALLCNIVLVSPLVLRLVINSEFSSPHESTPPSSHVEPWPSTLVGLVVPSECFMSASVWANFISLDSSHLFHPLNIINTNAIIFLMMVILLRGHPPHQVTLILD